jgi:cyanophycinase
MSPAFAFLGSGEFEPWHGPVDRWLLEHSTGDGSVVILPTASAPEGDEVFRAWGEKGLTHYRDLEIPAEVLDLRTRDDADSVELIDRLARASVVFVSGGNPAYVAATLAGSPLWARLRQRMEDGMAYAGCSAGVACLTDPTFDSSSRSPDRMSAIGLGYVTEARFAPHWDVVDAWFPGARALIEAGVPDGLTLVGLDEVTAMVGDGTAWHVTGRGGVHVLRAGSWTTFSSEDRFELPLWAEPPTIESD